MATYVGTPGFSTPDYATLHSQATPTLTAQQQAVQDQLNAAAKAGGFQAPDLTVGNQWLANQADPVQAWINQQTFAYNNQNVSPTGVQEKLRSQVGQDMSGTFGGDWKADNRSPGLQQNLSAFLGLDVSGNKIQGWSPLTSQSLGFGPNAGVQSGIQGGLSTHQFGQPQLYGQQLQTGQYPNEPWDANSPAKFHDYLMANPLYRGSGMGGLSQANQFLTQSSGQTQQAGGQTQLQQPALGGLSSSSTFNASPTLTRSNLQAPQQASAPASTQLPGTAQQQGTAQQGPLSQGAYNPNLPQATGANKGEQFKELVPTFGLASARQAYDSPTGDYVGPGFKEVGGFEDVSARITPDMYQQALNTIKNPPKAVAAEPVIGDYGQSQQVDPNRAVSSAQQIVKSYEDAQNRIGKISELTGLTPQQVQAYGNTDELQQLVNQANLKTMQTNPLFNQLKQVEDKYGIKYDERKGAIPVDIQREYMTRLLESYGINDLNQLGHTTVDKKDIYFNRASGQQLPSVLGGTRQGASGKGLTDIQLRPGPDGTAIPYAAFENKDKNALTGTILPLALAMFAPMAAPALGAAAGVGSAVGQGALYGGLGGALTSAATGGNILKGGLTGAALGGVGGSIGAGKGQFNPASSVTNNTLQAGALGAARGAATGLTGSLLTGNDLGRGVLGGALAGGVGGLSSQSLTSAGANPKIARAVGSALGNTAKSLAFQPKVGGLQQASNQSVAQPQQYLSSSQPTQYDISMFPEHVQRRLREIGVA